MVSSDSLNISKRMEIHRNVYIFNERKSWKSATIDLRCKLMLLFWAWTTRETTSKGNDNDASSKSWKPRENCIQFVLRDVDGV